MTLDVNTNIVSLDIQRSLSSLQNALGQNIQRLSSGVQINSAKDNPSGLAIADGMTSIIRGLNIAVRNANDAVSSVQTGESALSSISGILQSMRDLAVQSANATNTADDRVALNKEFTQLQAEITQITVGTNFNGQSLFDGSPKTFQVGPDAKTDNRITYQGVDLTADTSYTSIAAFISNGTTQASVDNAKSQFIAAGGAFNTSDGSAAGSGAAAYETVLAAFTKNVRPSVQATYDAATTAFINAHGSFSASDGSPVMAKSGTATIVITPGPIPPRQTATVPASTAADINAYNAFANAQSNFNAAATGVQILDASSALTSINAIDNASEEVDTEQAQQGALENRLNSVISSLQSSDDSQTAARSRIMDTDYAAETSSLARNQILEKAGFALLTQANQQTASVLSLLH